MTEKRKFRIRMFTATRKCFQVGGWTPPPGAHLTAMQSVNPFMHLAARAGIPGLVTTNVPTNTHQAKDEKLERQQDHTSNTVHIVQVIGPIRT